MLPLTLLAPQKLYQLLSIGDALQQEISALTSACNVTVAPVASSQIVLSSASASISDKNVQLSYPRICLYSSGAKNTQAEKFRSFSGSVSVTAEVWASANLIEDTEQAIHFYTGALTTLLQNNTGDWNDGLFFDGLYDLLVQSPSSGGFGFVQSAKVTCSLNVSQS